MIPGSAQKDLFLKKQGDREPGQSPRDQVEDHPVEDEEAYIICRQCNQPITRPADRIVINGSHHHTYANPHGIIYEIGCFRSAAGCGYSGPPTFEFTWFKGYQWRIALCSGCLTHLGWLFSASGSDQFHGLILDRLKQPD